MAKKVIMAMSGGVDSSVAAYLLKEKGYDVTGVIMQIWQDTDRCDIENRGGCCGFSAVDDARKVSAKLDIPFYVLNFRDKFKDTVIDYFVNEYLMGRTPNPCIACNRYVKWEALLDKSLSLGADYIATGHYADVIKLENGRYTLRRDPNNPKDQTYALYNLTQFQLEHTLMPLTGIQKDEVRKIAGSLGLVTANKPDSQEICFIPDNDYGRFIEDHIQNSAVPGNFIDEDGNILGRHKGIIYYTVGQRKGLGVAFGKPMFVKYINPEKNEIVLCKKDGVFFKSFTASHVNYMAYCDFNTIDCYVKIRYSHRPAECTLVKEENGISCVFKEPQRAVTPGQSAVFYDVDNNIICGGAIVEGEGI
ncbi:MAG: tRNA 2-thiouridine(34) synthase MnmA [Clostridiales bacterium]|jgi:tRNA-specific 2-thiouridylase|nr:tRNA 2-thiouridine(34) synthase MnmA [Clostridiales bacterium]